MLSCQIVLRHATRAKEPGTMNRQVAAATEAGGYTVGRTRD